jgi:crotonobetainyl-CoA:carnitine CoA-transferase CaiB-like acyl-CoA transferase
MTEVFQGIRVLDFTQGMAGPLATMIFADYGAEIIRVEPRGGDPWWSHPAYLLWQRGKKSVELDLSTEDGLSKARALIGSADVLVETYRPGEMSAMGLGYDSAKEINPALVYVSISAFGQEGPYKNVKAYDAIVNAKTGRMRDQVGWQHLRPTFRAVNDTAYHTAMFTVQATVAALRVAWMTGKGQYVDTSLLHGVTAPNNPWRRFEGEQLPADLYPGEEDPGARLRGELVADRKETDPYSANPMALCVECKDGRWIMHAHPQLNLFRAWIDAIGLSWVWDEERFKGAPLRWSDDADRIAFNLTIVEHFKKKTAQEWMDIYIAHPDCAGEIMQTTQDALRHEQFVHNGHIVVIDDPRVGEIHMVGPLARMSDTPAATNRPAPFPGEHTAEVLSHIELRKDRTPSGGNPRKPLEGVVTLELASWLAAPFSGALLADLGARVIKLEQLSGDPFRAMMSNEHSIRCTQGKESLAIDLKTDTGKDVLRRLVKRADALMHNYRPGVPERLGLDYESLKAINPDLVYLYAGSYGSTGPHSQRAAFNPTMGAFAGNSVFQSGEGNIPIGDQSPDPISGSGVATGIMLGLAAKWNTGVAQYVETTMMNSIVYCNSDDAFYYDGKPPRRNPDKNQLGLEATYRLYRCQDDSWVVLAAMWDDEFESLCGVIDRKDLPEDPRFKSVAARYENREDLGGQLELVFEQKDADTWESVLTAADVGCVRADTSGHKRFLYEDPQPRSIDFMVPTETKLFAEYAENGKYYRHSPQANFSETKPASGLPYCALGEFSRAILAEIGFTQDEISKLVDDGVVVEWDGQPVSKTAKIKLAI